MEPGGSGVYKSVVADFDEEQNPNRHQSERPDPNPDRHRSERSDPDPHKSSGNGPHQHEKANPDRNPHLSTSRNRYGIYQSTKMSYSKIS